MKRKIIMFMLTTGLICFICSCGANPDTPTETMPSSQEKASNTVNSNFESIDLNHTITKDFCEITVTKSVISHAANEEKTGLKLEEKQDNVWIVFLGTIKNTATSEIDFLSGFQAQILVDKKYTYPVEIAVKDKNGVVPLKTIDFAVYAAVPEEVISSCETYDFQFGFNDNFTKNLNSIDGLVYKYQISGKIDEYGSAEQIQNFQTFSEYISSFVLREGYSEKFEMKLGDEIVIIENGNCLKFVSDENVEVSIYPYLRLQYFSYELNIYEYGILEIRISGFRDQENTHYISTQAITLKSSAGEISIGEGLGNTYDYNNVSATNIFHFDSGELSLEEVYSIMNGEDLEIVLDVETLENEHTLLTYECDDELKENMIELIDIYRQLPNASLSK